MSALGNAGSVTDILTLEILVTVAPPVPLRRPRGWCPPTCGFPNKVGYYRQQETLSLSGARTSCDNNIIPSHNRSFESTLLVFVRLQIRSQGATRYKICYFLDSGGAPIVVQQLMCHAPKALADCGIRWNRFDQWLAPKITIAIQQITSLDN
jgi:hypothetical protein